jgi:hypothetical protein
MTMRAVARARLPIDTLEVDGDRILIESGSITIVEQASGRRDWYANAMFAEVLNGRRAASEVDVVIGTSGATLRGRAVVTGRSPFGITLAAAPGADDVGPDGET